MLNIFHHTPKYTNIEESSPAAPCSTCHNEPVMNAATSTHIDDFVMRRIQTAALDRWTQQQQQQQQQATNASSESDHNVPKDSQRTRSRRNVSRSHSPCAVRPSRSNRTHSSATKKSRAHQRASSDLPASSTHSVRDTISTRGPRSQRRDTPAGLKSSSSHSSRRVYRKDSKSKSRPETKTERDHAEAQMDDSAARKRRSMSPHPSTATRPKRNALVSPSAA